MSGSKGDMDRNDLLQQEHKHVPKARRARGRDTKEQTTQGRSGDCDGWARLGEEDEMFPGITHIPR